MDAVPARGVLCATDALGVCVSDVEFTASVTRVRHSVIIPPASCLVKCFNGVVDVPYGASQFGACAEGCPWSLGLDGVMSGSGAGFDLDAFGFDCFFKICGVLFTPSAAFADASGDLRPCSLACKRVRGGLIV